MTVVKELHPTHTCFEDIRDIWNEVLEPLIEKGEDLHETVRICHGIIPRSGRKREYSHAWVEHRNTVLECKRINSIDGPKCVISFGRREYYRRHKIKDFTAYTIREFSLLQLEHGHCGPFEDRYHALTRDPDYRDSPSSMVGVTNARI